MKKVLDADFETIMKDVKFSTTPREVVTIKDMAEYYHKMSCMGREVHE